MKMVMGVFGGNGEFSLGCVKFEIFFSNLSGDGWRGDGI